MGGGTHQVLQQQQGQRTEGRERNAQRGTGALRRLQAVVQALRSVGAGQHQQVQLSLHGQVAGTRPICFAAGQGLQQLLGPLLGRGDGCAQRIVPVQGLHALQAAQHLLLAGDGGVQLRVNGGWCGQRELLCDAWQAGGSPRRGARRAGQFRPQCQGQQVHHLQGLLDPQAVGVVALRHTDAAADDLTCQLVPVSGQCLRFLQCTLPVAGGQRPFQLAKPEVHLVLPPPAFGFQSRPALQHRACGVAMRMQAALQGYRVGHRIQCSELLFQCLHFGRLVAQQLGHRQHHHHGTDHAQCRELVMYAGDTAAVGHGQRSAKRGTLDALPCLRRRRRRR
jgi:hypothetical protein